MRLVSVIKRPVARLFLTILLFSGIVANAQENSPYSRYGWGNEMASTPVATRGMGGIGIGYVDYDPRYDFKQIYPHAQTVNFLNPASYARLKITSFDLGFVLENQVLTEKGVSEKYKATYANISYIQLGIPLSRKRNLAMVLGLRPVSRINYQILSFAREINPITGNSIDSTVTTYNGEGGSYQAYAGVGKAIGKLTLGANIGYYFGTKDNSTRKSFINDSVTYYNGNYQSKINFGGMFLQTGAQFATKVGSSTRLVLGATASFKKDYGAKANLIRETFNYSSAGGFLTKDSVYSEENVSGKVTFPGSFGFGFSFEKEDKWLIGVDYTTTNWDDFAIYGHKDSVGTNWKVKVGGQVIPNAFGTNYWGRVTYRFGFNYGPDYIQYQNEELKQYAVSVGFGFPIRPARFSNQYSNINLGFEFGRRGDPNTAMKENLFRLSFGMTLSDLWFVKRKYD
ncbi:hypothetical protein [Flavihumibacter fluvii]|uniref:hypothetical protein n=1 Tax=Flavihumibacter fluvii TaxID=2838157 RepID=UPI001BDEC653|nr:hypothetical protein [Flavihumibacter fluvii]ULQ51457.1 hypothetical protein KJS93_15320 [Flavihumibacter fluvii]